MEFFFALSVAVACAICIFCSTARAAEPCTNPPRYGLGPIVCAEGRQAVMGGCSEEIIWSATPGAKWYSVRRWELDINLVQIGPTVEVGVTPFIPAHDEEGEIVPDYSPTMWLPALDTPMPVVGKLYRYDVAGCNEYGCGPYSSTTETPSSVLYKAACHDCDGGTPTLCPGSAP